MNIRLLLERLQDSSKGKFKANSSQASTWYQFENAAMDIYVDRDIRTHSLEVVPSLPDVDSRILNNASLNRPVDLTSANDDDDDDEQYRSTLFDKLEYGFWYSLSATRRWS